MRLAALTSFRPIVNLCRLHRLGLAIVRLRQFPPRHPLQHAVGVLDGVHVSIVGFNHVDGSSHLLGKEIHVHAFLQSERSVGVPEAIGRARHALRAFAQFRFVQKVGNQLTVKSFFRLARGVGKDSIFRFRRFGYNANTL